MISYKTIVEVLSWLFRLDSVYKVHTAATFKKTNGSNTTL